MNIDMPFLPDWEQSMLNGLKTMTCRSKAYGQPGDTFTKYGATFEIVSISKMPLRRVADEFHIQEGCASPAAYIEVWNQIHPRRRFVGTDVRFLHEFRLVQP